MKRTRKNQLDSLINHTEDKKHKNILKTRGANPLIQSIEPKLKKMNPSRHVNEQNGLEPLLFIFIIATSFSTTSNHELGIVKSFSEYTCFLNNETSPENFILSIDGFPLNTNLLLPFSSNSVIYSDSINS